MVTINIDGKDRKLYFGIEELDMIEQFHGFGMGMLLSPSKRGISVTMSLLWAGLSRYSDEYRGEQGRKDLMLKFEEWVKHGDHSANLKILREKIDSALDESGMISTPKKDQGATDQPS